MATLDVTISNGRTGEIKHQVEFEVSDDLALALVEKLQQALNELSANYTLNRLTRLSDGVTLIEISAVPGRPPGLPQEET
ncbi:MAG: hypothetical protein Kow0031_10880 [Anaerolineae bacterium]